MKLNFGLLAATLVLGLAPVAQAKAHKDHSGIEGRIVAVSLHSITITEKGNAGQVTIKVDASTTIEVDGVSGKKVTDLQAGERVIIQGGTDGPATDIAARSHQGGKHKSAA